MIENRCLCLICNFIQWEGLKKYQPFKDSWNDPYYTDPEFRDFGLNLSISFQKNSNAEEDFDRHIELDKIEADDWYLKNRFLLIHFIVRVNLLFIIIFFIIIDELLAWKIVPKI